MGRVETFGCGRSCGFNCALVSRKPRVGSAIQGTYFQSLEVEADFWHAYPLSPSGKRPRYRGLGSQIGGRGHLFFRCFTISLAALAPEPPVNPAPGWVPEPQRNKFAMGVEYRAQSSNGRMVKN